LPDLFHARVEIRQQLLAATATEFLLHQIFKSAIGTVIIQPIGAMAAKYTLIRIVIAALAARLHPTPPLEEQDKRSLSMKNKYNAIQRIEVDPFRNGLQNYKWDLVLKSWFQPTVQASS
jgi:hypothetical protein